MAKSKRSIKRRKKVKNRTSKGSNQNIDTSFDKPYMKTDGTGRVCKYDRNHKFLGYASDEESKDF